jgi:hypothetical protein
MQYFIRPLRAMAQRTPTARALAGALGAAALALGLVVVAAAPASLAATNTPVRPAATAKTYDLTSGAATFKSDGHTWQLVVGVLGGSAGGTNAVDFYITTPHLGGTEMHEWNTTTLAPAKDFSVSSKGSATLSTGTFMSPIASFSLKFTPSSHASEVCVSGKGTVYKGAVSGKVSLKTGLHGVGVSSKKLSFKGAELLAGQTCAPPLPCFLTGWDFGSPTKVFVEGYQARLSDKIESDTLAGKFHATTASKVLDRTDDAFIAAPAPVFDAKTKSLTVSASKAGIVTGAGVIAHAVEPIKPQTTTCYVGKQKYAETDSFYEGTFTASKPFEAHTLLTGNLTALKTGVGEFEVVTLKKK